MPHLHWIDYLIIIAILFSTMTGFFRGFVKELMAVCLWVASLWIAIMYWHVVAQFLQTYIHDKTVCGVLAFLGIVLTVFILGAIVNSLLSVILNRSGLTGTDRLLGMGFGFLRGLFIVALVMLVVKMTGMPDQEKRESSYLYTHFDPLVQWMYGFTPALMHQMQGLDVQELDAVHTISIRPDA